MMEVEKCSISKGDAGAVAEEMADYFGPAQVDQFIRQAVQFCWMALPKERRNRKDLEKQFRRLVDRALNDFNEDNKAFGQTGHKRPSRRRLP